MNTLYNLDNTILVLLLRPYISLTRLTKTNSINQEKTKATITKQLLIPENVKHLPENKINNLSICVSIPSMLFLLLLVLPDAVKTAPYICFWIITMTHLSPVRIIHLHHYILIVYAQSKLRGLHERHEFCANVVFDNIIES